jgi:hypothetical protein
VSSVTHSFCTYFDSRYLPHARTLRDSMRRHLGDFRLYALCMDNESFETLVDERSTDTVPISRADFEAWQPRVAGTASSRSLIEYYFTCSGALPAYVLEKYPVSAKIPALTWALGTSRIELLREEHGCLLSQVYR